MSIQVALQGYIAREKHPPRRTLQLDYTQGPVVVLGGGAVSYEPGTPVNPQPSLPPPSEDGKAQTVLKPFVLKMAHAKARVWPCDWRMCSKFVLHLRVREPGRISLDQQGHAHSGYPKPKKLNPQPSTFNPQPSTLYSQPSTLNPQPSILNLEPQTIGPELQKKTCYPQAYMLRLRDSY